MEDGTLDGGLIALHGTERLMEDGVALLNTGLSMEDVALNAGQKCQLRTEHSAEGGALDAGLESQWNLERSLQDSFT